MDSSLVHEGMMVLTENGGRLGRVFSLGPQHFNVESGFLSRTDYAVLYDEIAGVEGDTITLTCSEFELTEMPNPLAREQARMSKNNSEMTGTGSSFV